MIPISQKNKTMSFLWPLTHTYSGPYRILSTPFPHNWLPVLPATSGVYKAHSPWTSCSLCLSVLSPDISPTQPFSSFMSLFKWHFIVSPLMVLHMEHPSTFLSFLCFAFIRSTFYIPTCIFFIVSLLLVECRVHGKKVFFYICLS